MLLKIHQTVHKNRLKEKNIAERNAPNLSTFSNSLSFHDSKLGTEI